MKHTFLFLLLAVYCFCTAGTVAANQKARKASEMSPELASFIVNVNAAMPEVSADLLIRIAESKLLTNRQKKIELLEEAFSKSAHVQQKTRLTLRTGAVDSRGGFLSAAYDQQLDALSLRCRVVKAMLRLDVERARKLFLEIPKIDLPVLSCSQTLAYDLTEFYQTMSQVALKAFSPIEIQQGERVRFIQSYLEVVESPAQVSPAIFLLVNSNLSAVDLAIVSKSFHSSLGRVSADPRSFIASILEGNLIRNLELLLGQYKDNHLPTSELVSTFHSYLLRQLNSVQCEDVIRSQSQMKQLWANLDHFSTWLPEPIKAEEVKPARVEGIEGNEQFWTSRDAWRLLMKVKGLRFGDGNEPLSQEARTSDDWQQKMELVLEEITRWDGSSEKTGLIYFHEKSNLYSSLFDLSPTRSGRMRVLLRFADFLRNADTKDESRIEWLLHLRGLLKKMQRLDAPDRARVLNVFKNSGNQAIQLYANFDLLMISPKREI